MGSSSSEQATMANALPTPSRHANRTPLLDSLWRSSGIWTRRALSMQELLNKQALPDLLLIFVPTEADPLSTQAQRFRAQNQMEISEKFMVPTIFWTDVAQKASGFFGSQEFQAKNGARGYNILFQFLIKEARYRKPVNAQQVCHTALEYEWHKLAFIIHWVSPNTTAAFCFDIPDEVKGSIIQSLMATSIEISFNNPFAILPAILQEVTTAFDTALWQCRDLVRDIEKSRTAILPEPDYVRMHELARHTIHSTETLEMAMETVASMTRDHERYFQSNFAHGEKLLGSFEQIQKCIGLQSTLLKCLFLRSRAIDARLHNEINLAFNMVAQHDGRIQMRIAEATQSDSTAMKMIAFLGFAFLPGTFISAIFSMSFFNFDPGNDKTSPRWTVSDQFWVYWAAAVPTTVVAMLLGFVSLRVFAKRSSAIQRN